MPLATLFLTACCAGVFLCYPSGTIASWLGLTSAGAEVWYLRALGTGFVGSALLVGLRGKTISLFSERREEYFTLTWAHYFLLGLLFVRVFFLLDHGLNDDERRVGDILSHSSFTSVFNPSLSTQFFPNSPNHVLAHATSWLSIQLFGTAAWAIRLPTVLFAMIFLIGLAKLLSYLSYTTSMFVLLHLCANSCVAYYTATSRGYISMLAFSTLLTWYLVAKKLRLDVLVVILVLLSLTHTFGAVFGVMCGVAYSLSTHKINDRKTMFKALLLISPLVLLLFIRELTGWHRAGGAREELFHAGKLIEVMHTFGLDHFRVAKGLVVLFVTAMVTRTFLDKHKDLFFYLAWIAVLGFGITVWANNVGGLRGRFFLAYLIPFLIFLVQTVERIRVAPLRRAIYLALFFLLVVAPTRVSFRDGLDAILFQR